MSSKIIQVLKNFVYLNNNVKKSAVVILQGLKENSALKVLYLNGYNMTRQVAEDLAQK